VSLRLGRASRLLDSAWSTAAVAPPGETALGFSFRLPQAEIMGLEPRAALAELLTLDLGTVRLAALWNRFEHSPGAFDATALDWQVDAAESAGKQVIIGVGAVKNFGYPEFYVPEHQLAIPIREGSLVTRRSHEDLLESALGFITRVVERYRSRKSVIAWQVEHEAVDPLGLEHLWRLSTDFVSAEADLLRRLDPGRPLLLNAFIPMSAAARIHQRWRTRDQGDSLALAVKMADVVGLDVYPRYALAGMGDLSLYLDGGGRSGRRHLVDALRRVRSAGRSVMVTEGQGEPWETATNPPNPRGRVPASCPPEGLIANYSACMEAAAEAGLTLSAYLFWGAEYWLAREQLGDSSYLAAIARVASQQRRSSS
jgi:hypothetical protein